MAGIRVGTCGFAGRQADAFREIDIVEVQRSFYQPPRPETARRWRERAPPGFRFAVKAWQLVTHRRSSPTYRRLREPLDDGRLEMAGNLAWNEVTRMAWNRTREIADALEAEAVVLQTPRSFGPGDENLERLATFFSQAPRDGRWMVFEPRGEAWTDELMTRLVEEHRLVHGVDPFLRAPIGDGPTYLRLHGRPAYNYRYQYTDADFGALRRLLPEQGEVRVLFNNHAMAEDARRFRASLG